MISPSKHITTLFEIIFIVSVNSISKLTILIYHKEVKNIGSLKDKDTALKSLDVE
jgi:hypothetical protein